MQLLSLSPSDHRHRHHHHHHHQAQPRTSMISNKRRDFTATRSPLSITQTVPLADDPNGAHYAAWAEGIKCNQNPGAWSRWSPRNYNHGGDAAGFKWLAKPNDSVDDFPSPRLWDQNPPPPPRPQPPRAQLIAMYRQEMIESMRDVPESAYELSLRDMVDMPRKTELDSVQQQQQQQPAIDDDQLVVRESPSQEKSVEKEVKSKGEEERKEETVGRSKSMDGGGGGFLLRMFFPFSFGSSRRRKKSGGRREKSVAAADGEECSSEKYKDRCSSSGSSSSTTTSSSNSSTSTSIVTSRRKLGSCYSFMLTHRGVRGVHE